MGEANRRGSYDARKKLAVSRMERYYKHRIPLIAKNILKHPESPRWQREKIKKLAKIAFKLGLLGQLSDELGERYSPLLIEAARRA